MYARSLRILPVFLIAALALAFFMVNGATQDKTTPISTPSSGKTETATFGMGCFWCSQALFEKFGGITSTGVGYAGGHTVSPTYEDVCTDQTGHAESIQVTFDPKKITYSQLLDIFWNVHDPTTLNQQGADQGTQYRSIILYSSPEQKELAEASKKAQEVKLGKPVTTEIVPLTAFYRAEEYHQDYFKKNPHAPYCLFVIDPKLVRLELHPPASVKLAK